MKDFKQQLLELQEVVEANKLTDWDINDPVDEFKAIGVRVDAIINQLPSKEDLRIEKASEYLCNDDIPAALELIEAADEIEPSTRLDDVDDVMVWEKVELQWTVEEFLEYIS